MMAAMTSRLATTSFSLKNVAVLDPIHTRGERFGDPSGGV